MALVELNFGLEDVEDSFKPLPGGQYACKLTKQELAKSQAGNTMLKIEWEITDGDFIGRKLFDNVVIFDDPEKAWKLKQYAALIGVEAGKSFDPALFVGIEAIVTLDLKEQTAEQKEYCRANGYDEGPRNNIKKVVLIG